MSSKSTLSATSRKVAKQKPDKPYPDFPLTPHPSGRWCKKIRGRLHYFGKWDDPQGALDLYAQQRDELYAGRTPRPRNDDRMTLKDLCNEFLTYKKHLVETGELTARSHRDYYDTCERLLSILGRNIIVEKIRPDDMLRVRDRLSTTLGPVALANEIGRVRVLFNYAYAEERIEKPVRFGKAFRKPSKRVLRQHKAQRETENGKKFFEPSLIRKMLNAADVHAGAMILLGINCGFGNADCGKLPMLALDLRCGWVSFPRPKTGIPRRCKLWAETVKALRESLANRTAPKDEKHDGLVFITKYGQPWFKDSSSTNPVSQQFRKLLVALGLYRQGKHRSTNNCRLVRVAITPRGNGRRNNFSLLSARYRLLRHHAGKQRRGRRERGGGRRLVRNMAPRWQAAWWPKSGKLFRPPLLGWSAIDTGQLFLERC